jgi:phosphoglycolate phosphatase
MVRLVVFDCDGTLVDSQHVIVATMTRAFAAHDLVPPAAAAVRRVVGLSLAEAIGRLIGDPEAELRHALARSYRQAFAEIRREPGFSEPMFEGAREVLVELDRRGHLLAMATGKSMRGARAVLEHHDIAPLFASVQTADGNPGKPHPGMLLRVMGETGSRPEETVFVGDTTFDVIMGKAAAVRPIGVASGYHHADELRLAGAEVVLERFAQLLDHLTGPPR